MKEGKTGAQAGDLWEVEHQTVNMEYILCVMDLMEDAYFGSAAPDIRKLEFEYGRYTALFGHLYSMVHGVRESLCAYVDGEMARRRAEC